MPTRFLDDSTPIVQFEPQLEVSPFILFRRLKEGRPPLLVDVRPDPGALTLAGAIPYPGPEWSPPADEDVIEATTEEISVGSTAAVIQAALGRLNFGEMGRLGVPSAPKVTVTQNTGQGYSVYTIVFTGITNALVAGGSAPGRQSTSRLPSAGKDEKSTWPRSGRTRP